FVSVRTLVGRTPLCVGVVADRHAGSRCSGRIRTLVALGAPRPRSRVATAPAGQSRDRALRSRSRLLWRDVVLDDPFPAALPAARPRLRDRTIGSAVAA